jgi:hypothetical protein
MGLSGLKDIDLKIIQGLDDNELGKVCQVNKYVNSLCNDESFWLQRILNNFKTLNSEETNRMKVFLGFSYRELYKFLKTFPIFTEDRKVFLRRGQIIHILK